MQDSQVGFSGSEPGLKMCVRCSALPVVFHELSERLCSKCLDGYRRYRTDIGGDKRGSVTDEDFITGVPLRNTKGLQSRRIEALPDNEPIPGFMVFGPVTASLVEKIRKLAKSDFSVLIHGETGTGKELVAKAIHMLSARSTKPFVPVNCATIASALAESEMFGHVRGAFTGANHNTDGFFRKADGGTLFFDEVVDMPLETQAKLLRVLQDGEVRSVGSSEIKHVDVRVISAANRDLEEKGDFRGDLYHRLGIVLNVLPLRKRKEEIPQLAQYLANKIAKRSVSIDGNVISAFMSYSWPGNIRELEGALREGVAYSEGGIIQVQHLPSRVLSGKSKL